MRDARQDTVMCGAPVPGASRVLPGAPATFRRQQPRQQAGGQHEGDGRPQARLEALPPVFGFV